MDVGAEAALAAVDLAMMGVERLELAVDLLGPPRRGQHRHDDQQQESRQAAAIGQVLRKNIESAY